MIKTLVGLVRIDPIFATADKVSFLKPTLSIVVMKTTLTILLVYFLQSSTPFWLKYANDILPTALLDQITHESKLIYENLLNNPALQDDKKPTYFMKLDEDEGPRCAIEEAITNFFYPYMLKQKVTKQRTENNSEPMDSRVIIGAEWWIQSKNIDEGIGFHYDKDEGHASSHHEMIFPVYSTITYLTGNGYPTVIFNMTTLDGNSDTPTFPNQLYLSFPRTNRHVIFDGNLQHGVIDALKNPAIKNKYALRPNEDSSTDSRVTLLVNWWTKVPLQPNCVPLSTKTLYTILRYPHQVSYELLADPSSNGSTNDPLDDHPAIPLYPPSDLVKMTSEEITITFPPRDYYAMLIPYRTLWKDDQLHTQWGGLYELRLPDRSVFGAITYLDLFHPPVVTSIDCHTFSIHLMSCPNGLMAQVNHMFSIALPKTLIIYDAANVSMFRSVLRTVRPLAKKYFTQLKIYLCDTDRCRSGMESFGYDIPDLPKVVIDDTVRRQQFHSPYDYFNANNVERFWIETLDNLQSSSSSDNEESEL